MDKKLIPPIGKCWLVRWDIDDGTPIGACGSKLNKKIMEVAKMADIWDLHLQWTDYEFPSYLDTWAILMV